MKRNSNPLRSAACSAVCSAVCSAACSIALCCMKCLVVQCCAACAVLCLHSRITSSSLFFALSVALALVDQSSLRRLIHQVDNIELDEKAGKIEATLGRLGQTIRQVEDSMTVIRRVTSQKLSRQDVAILIEEGIQLYSQRKVRTGVE